MQKNKPEKFLENFRPIKIYGKSLRLRAHGFSTV